MEKYALVLTGTLLPGHDADKAWPALAAYFRMEERKVTDQLVPRAPVTLKESDDLTKLQSLQDGLRGIGADSEIHPIDERGNLFAAIGGTARGPVPYTFVDAKVSSGDWSGATEVAEVGSERWLPFSRLHAKAPPAPPPPQRTNPVEDTAYMPAPRDLPNVGGAAARTGYAAPGERLEHGEQLPAGDAIHAGFWRRGAATFLDGLILLVPSYIVGSIPFFGWLLHIVGLWLYFALMESGPKQATLGKQAFRIKVTDDYGRRIDLARATGRHFAKFLSSLLLLIGYIMAGVTVRKQGLHDLLASCCVVFDDVAPDLPLPTEREPLPWYGWAINIVFLLGIPVCLFGLIFAMFYGAWRW